MHTFFINTSEKSIHDFGALFDIHVENRAFVSLEYPIKDWFDQEKGYVACVQKMGDLIDGYAELNNAYNLLVYVDVSENEEYCAIPRDAFHDKERSACLRAMHIIFTHVMSQTLVTRLIDCGRRPQDVLIMFGTDKDHTDFIVAKDDPSIPAVREKLFGYLGLPESALAVETAKAVLADPEENKVQLFGERIESLCKPSLVPGLRKSYQNELYLWSDSMVHDKSEELANSELFDQIAHINRVESDRGGVEIVTCPYDCYASTVNKSALALSQLNIALYILACLDNGSIYLGGKSSRSRKVIPFRACTPEEVAPKLREKLYIYTRMEEQTTALTEIYSELGLAPRMKAFNHDLFGLSKHGDVAKDIQIKDVPKQTDEAATDGTIVPEDAKEVVVVEKEISPLFTDGKQKGQKKEYVPFDPPVVQEDEEKLLRLNTPPEEYIRQSKKMRLYHLDYLKNLRTHITRVLSNYAGKSRENKAALLQMNTRRYTTNANESDVLETVSEVSKKSYETVLRRFMEFNAGRSVALNDVQAQCDWFVTRIYQIERSLKLLGYAAIGTGLALLVLYVPYVVVQWEAIVESAVTVATALASIAIPAVALYLVFGLLAMLQKRKYLKTWQKFKENFQKILEENTLAVKKYDTLLHTMIPALRWVYEYRLDVLDCIERCAVADAKVEHHRTCLLGRITAVKNILSDLEMDTEIYAPPVGAMEPTADSVDFTSAFCAGDKNRAFYTVLSGKELLTEKS